MRSIVVGPITADRGVSTIGVWFRFPVANTNRQVYYTTHGQSGGPQAPGDYTATSGADFAEVAQLAGGQWVERNFVDIIDPTNGTTLVQQRLVNIYNTAASSAGTADSAALAFWASSLGSGGTAWSMKSS